MGAPGAMRRSALVPGCGDFSSNAIDPFERGSSRGRQNDGMTNAALAPALPRNLPGHLPRNLARIRPADFAALFSGEDAPEAPRAMVSAGLLQAGAALFIESLRTLADSSELRASSQALTKRAM